MTKIVSTSHLYQLNQCSGGLSRARDHYWTDGIAIWSTASGGLVELGKQSQSPNYQYSIRTNYHVDKWDKKLLLTAVNGDTGFKRWKDKMAQATRKSPVGVFEMETIHPGMRNYFIKDGRVFKKPHTQIGKIENGIRVYVFDQEDTGKGHWFGKKTVEFTDTTLSHQLIKFGVKLNTPLIPALTEKYRLFGLSDSGGWYGSDFASEFACEYPDEKGAKARCEELAKLNPGQKFAYVKVLGTCFTNINPVIWE